MGELSARLDLRIMEKLNLLVCENNACEIKKAISIADFDNIEVITYPSVGCLSSSKNNALTNWRKNLELENRKSIIICSATCSIQKEIFESNDIKILKSQHCLAFIAGNNIINEYAKQGGYIVNSGWLNNWESHIAEMGFNQETAKMFFNETSKKIVFLDACENKRSLALLEGFSQYIELPYEIIKIDINCTVTLIEKIELEWQTDKLQENVKEKNMEIAEYATLFDLMNRVAKFNTEVEVIEEIKSTLKMLYAPEEILFWKKGTEGVPHLKSILSDPNKKYGLLDSKNGFLLKVEHENELLGVFEFKNILMPEYIERYIKSVLNIIDLFGLAISNANNYTKIIESRKHFDDTIYQAEQISSIGIFEVNWELDTQYWSNGMCAILGFDENKPLTYIDMLKYIHEDDCEYANAQITESINDNKLTSLEFRIVNNKNETLYLDCILRTIFDKKGKLLKTTGVCRNITANRLLVEENLELETKLAEKNRIESLGTLARGFAHEINNPLNGVLNYGQLILDSDNTDSDIEEYAQEIINESERIAQIIKSVLHFSEQEHQPKEEIEIIKLMERVYVGINYALINNSIKIKPNIEKEVVSLYCRISQIQQVLINIIQNSINSLSKKYLNADKSKLIEISIRKIEKGSSPYVRIEIKDNGTGIPRDIQGKIFEPFFSTLTKDKAKGLGLTYSKKIAEEHHGELTFETKEGEYTKFYLDLPFDNGV